MDEKMTSVYAAELICSTGVPGFQTSTYIISCMNASNGGP